MLVTILLTFVITVAACAAGLLFAAHRIASHCRGNAEATAAVVNHVLVSLLGRRVNPAAPAGDPHPPGADSGEEQPARPQR